VQFYALNILMIIFGQFLFYICFLSVCYSHILNHATGKLGVYVKIHVVTLSFPHFCTNCFCCIFLLYSFFMSFHFWRTLNF